LPHYTAFIFTFASLQSALIIGFMDDAMLGGHMDVVANDNQHINCFGELFFFI
jgi:hypothetical protein